MKSQVGTRPYRAPEMLVDNYPAYSFGVDIWSTGAVHFIILVLFGPELTARVALFQAALWLR